MRTRLLAFAILNISFVGLAAAGRVDISLSPSEWMDYGAQTSARALSQTPEGYLRAACNTYRGYINYRTTNTYNFQGAAIRYKWRVNCGGGAYCWNQDGAYPWSRMSASNLTTSHSWAGSIVISNNTWIYTELHFNKDRTWSADYSYTGYGNGGINRNSGTITEANWTYLADSFLSKYVGDGYANSFYFEIAEAYLETPGPQTAITSPAEGAVFDPNEPILFSAAVTGGTEPYGFEWASDRDGVLGSGQTFETTSLSEGMHQITVTCTDAAEETGSASITVYVLVPPVIAPIAHHTITDGGSYTGPTPALVQGAAGVMWSLVEGPAGMTIDAATGKVSWAVPVTTGSPFTITVRAENPKGADQVSWQLDVIKTPSFATMLWAAIQDGLHGIDGHDAFTRTAIDLDGNVLAAGYLDSVAGHQDAAYLVKYSPEGSVIWSKTLDAISYSGKAEYNDRFTDVAVDSENNVIVVGSKSGNWTSYSLGSYHNAWWVQKYTPDGQTLLWEKLWQDTASSAWQGANGVCLDAADNIYVTGSSFGAWSSIEQQWVTFKYDKNGNVLLGPIKANFVVAYYLPDYSYDITADAAGNMYVAGARGVSGSDGGITNNADWHVRKYNAATGATIWQDTYSGAAGRLDYAMGTVLDSQGSLLVVGYTNKGTNSTTNLNYDWLMIKYDGATGARLWTQTYESRLGASEVCYQAVVDDNDDFYVSGYLQNAGGVLQRRIAKLSGIDGTTLAEAVWQSDTNSYLTGLARRGDLLAAAGMLSNGTDNDAFVSLLTVSSAVKILSPAFNMWSEAGTPIAFSAELVGFAEPPFYYRWASDIDGEFGTGHTVEFAGLSSGEHQITCRLEHGDGQIMQSMTRVVVAMRPQVTPIDDQMIGEGQAYTGPVPSVNEEALPVSWSLAQGPSGMTINAQTGQVVWADPVGSEMPYHITIRAENPLGTAQASWQLSVLSMPKIAELSAQAAFEFTPFTSSPPTLLKGTPPVSWSLVSGPALMTIDADTGAVSWETPLPSFTAYSVTIRATNAVGSDTTAFAVAVYSMPQIVPISDVTIIGGQTYSMTPTLLKGVPTVIWSLDAAPPQMTIDAGTGAVAWPSPGPEDSVHTITVRAANTMGSHTQSYQIRVMLPPVIETPDDDTVHEGAAYQKSIGVSQGTAPLTFTLVNGPAGMSINAATGLLSLAYPNGNAGPYTVTVRVSNAVGSAQAGYTLTVLQRPVIKPVASGLAAEGAAYNAPAPQLFQGSAPVTWSLVSAPAGMTVDAPTGAVSWPAAVFAGSPHTVTVQAQNVVGTDSKTWQVTVIQPPVIAGYGDKIAGNAVSYIAPLPILSQGTHVTWSLDEAPAGMTINAASGQMVWPSPVASPTPHTVRIKAENIAGSAIESFSLTILAKPLLETIGDIEIAEHRPYTGPAATLLAGQLPVTFSLTQAPAGMTADPADGAISWAAPTAVGSPHTVKLRAANAYGNDEKAFSVRVPIGYAAEAWTDIDTAPSGTPIPIVGRAYYLSDGSAAAGVTVHLHVTVRDIVRLYKPVTDAQGEFAFMFTPLPGEAGHYTIHSGHPLQVPQDAQDSFTLAALQASDTKLRPDLIEGAWYETTVRLTNPGNTALTQIQAAKVGGPDSIEMEFEPIAALAGDTTVSATLRFHARDASVRQSVISVRFASEQGAAAALAYSARVIPLTPELAVYPATLEAGMVRGQSRTVSFEVYNKGGKATPELSVLIPNAPWLSMHNPVVIGVHQPQDVTVITLTLSPDETLPLGPYQGMIYVFGTDMSQSMPFTFTCASDKTGRLDVQAVDEFTYYAAGAPRVENVRLTLRDAFSGEAVYFNEPMPDGRLLLDEVAEGYYTLDLQAPEHGAYRATLYASPGVTGTITAFMPRELVKYTWTVVPTEIEDVYTVTLDTTFETNVPAPVVVVEPANVDLSKMVDGRMQVDFTITNYGLIAAEEFYLQFDDHPRYRVELLTDFKGRVGPGQTIVVPAIITDLRLLPASAAAGLMGASPLSPFLGDCDPVKGGGYYTLVCGKDGKWKKVPVTLANWTCNLVNIIRGIAGGDDEEYDDQHDYEEDSTPRDERPDTGSGKTPVTPPPSKGGIVKPTPPPGKPRPPRGPGDSPKAPYNPPPTIFVGGSGDKSCDPCPQQLLDAALSCVWGFVPTKCFPSFFKGIHDCVMSCVGEDYGSDKCLIGCGGGLLSFVSSCTGDLTGLNTAYNVVSCIYGLATACNASSPAAYASAAGEFKQMTGLEMPAEMPTSDALERLLEQARRLEMLLDAVSYNLGDPIWFSGVPGEEHLLTQWLYAYEAAIDESGDGAEWITPAELESLRTMPRPSQVSEQDAEAACLRWNRTVDYRQIGKFRTTDLEPGDNTDFIATDIVKSRFVHANQAVLDNEAEGFSTFYDGLSDALDQLKLILEPETKGVCAKVQLQIQQSAVLTRTGFRATLAMQNLSAVDSLDELSVEVVVFDSQGGEATGLFGMYPPAVTGIADVAGGGSLSPGMEFEAEWRIVPTIDAAPLVETYYFVGGSIHYFVNGRAVTIPIIPDTITVKPDANLHLKYFFARDVYGDDPFTPDAVEPSAPFVLGLRVDNTGAGNAYNMTIHSARPTIVRQEQDKDILIDFELLDVQVGDEPCVPSLLVSLGTIAPHTGKTAIWRMQSSLQGKFIDYEAHFSHTDTLGDPRLSLIQSVSTHELIRAVLAPRLGDDAILDFLTNDTPDSDGLPDTLHVSDGTVEPVDAFIGDAGWLSGTPASGQVTLTLPQTPGGLFYVRLPNPGWPQYVLTQAIRSDGKTVPLENVWTTWKMNYPEDEPAYAENFVYLFDHDSTGLYTLVYAAAANLPPVVSAISVADLTAVSGLPLELTVTYQDEVGIDETSLGDDNITVVGPQGQPLTVQFRQIVSQQGGRMDVLYHILPPKGLWEGSINGLYAVYAADAQVADGSGQCVDAALLGGFAVSIPECINLDVIRCELKDQRRISQTVFEFTYAAVVENHCPAPIRNLRAIPQSLPDNLTLTAHDLRFCYIPADGEATSLGTFTVRMDYDNPPDTQGVLSWQWQLFGAADATMDGVIDLSDLAAFAAAWLTDDPCYDWRPMPAGDGRVDLQDFSSLTERWLISD